MGGHPARVGAAVSPGRPCPAGPPAPPPAASRGRYKPSRAARRSAPGRSGAAPGHPRPRRAAGSSLAPPASRRRPRVISGLPALPASRAEETRLFLATVASLPSPRPEVLARFLHQNCSPGWKQGKRGKMRTRSVTSPWCAGAGQGMSRTGDGYSKLSAPVVGVNWDAEPQRVGGRTAACPAGLSVFLTSPACSVRVLSPLVPLCFLLSMSLLVF